MMDTDAAQTDEAMRDGLGIDSLLALGGVFGLLGWGLTQLLANRPGFALDAVGVEGTVVVVGLWAAATVALVGLGLLAGARTVRYSPLLWLWVVLVAAALALDVAVVYGVVSSPELARTLLWTPWPVVLALGYLVTGVVATHRARAAYLVGSLAAGLVLLAAVLFPPTVPGWAFAATGVVHAVPLLVDARLGGGTDEQPVGTGYEFRDVPAAGTEEEP
ncbi:hypothetical protein [Haloarchaeobius litoreus]|uniref:Uncharacterized protein n=1 Tax=Haloarchaeobius litoreus TaxID=755306 RepID=A0ABD6DMD8_9EURY|nr:hypothetical protein [Haloarchaeobius litoreus]